jgi:hypothetical protein
MIIVTSKLFRAANNENQAIGRFVNNDHPAHVGFLPNQTTSL